MNLSGRQLLVLLELYVVHDGIVGDVGQIENHLGWANGGPLSSLEKMKLVKIGPRDVDQSSPVRLTRAGDRIAKAMVEAAEGALT